ncbi:MAG: lipase family protein, partial [Wolbachia sp.]
KDKEITIVYRGSRNRFDYMKDTEMILTSSDGLLPEGGKIHSGFYSLFKGSWDSVYEILRGYANDQQLEIKDFKINLTGHSMGGAIANIAALCLSVREGAEDLHVATFASPRVFDSSAAKVYEERLGKKTIRVVNQSDPIPLLPLGSMGYKHVGERLVITSRCSLQRAHLLDIYRNLIINIEPDKFKSDNSVSIYYPLSYLTTGLYNVLTTMPGYFFQSMTSTKNEQQYFKQVKNKHKDASLSEMMKYSGSSNEQKAVIYEDSEPGEDGFITFVMPSLHRHGRSKGLKINPPYIAFFVNNNYYLSGNTISPRLSKTLPQQKSVVSMFLSIGNSTSSALCVATSDAQQVVPHGGAKIFNKFYKKNATGLSVEFIAGNISEIVRKLLNAGISQVVVPTSTGSSVFLNFNDISKANQEELQKIAKALMGLFTRGESNSSTVNAINDFSTVKTPALEQKSGKNEQAPIQLAGHVIREDPIQVVQPQSLVNLEILNEHHSNITANTNDEGVGTTINDQSTSIISSDGRNKQTPILTSPPIVPKKSEELAAQTAQDTSVRDGVTKNDNVVASVSSNDNPSDSSEIRLDESRTGSDQVSNQSTEHITKMDNERAPLGDGNSKLESNQQDLQPEALPIVLNGNPNNITVINKNVKMPILEQKSDTKTNSKQPTNPNNGGVTAPSVQLAASKSVDKDSDKKDTQQKLIPTGIPLVASKNSNLVNNVQGNSKQPSYPDKNNPASQNAKSKLPVIAASMLAITGVATGIAIAVYLEMLAVGIAVGACCLVAAAIVYCYSRPSSSLGNSNIQGSCKEV